MTTGVQYKIVPLVDREHNKKVACNLENKYKTSSNKRVTLNERFGVLEKGYILQTEESTAVEKNSDVLFVVHDRNLISKKEFVENYLAKNPVPEATEQEIEEDKEDKENAPTKKSTPKTDPKKEFTTDDYVRDITKSILRAV